MKDKFLNKTKTMICLLLILTTVITFISKEFQNDIFFDLKTGENILKYGIDFKDHFSFIPNLTYIYHHWLYDLIILKIHSVGKFDALFAFFIIVFFAFGISVFYVNNKKNNKLIALLTTIFTIYLSSHAFMTRVQSITYIFLFLEIYFLEKLYKKGKKKYSVYLIIMAILTVNLHMPIWIIYIVFTMPYLVETILYLISKKLPLKKIKTEKPKDSKLSIYTFAILLLTGLISPLKLYPYTFITKVINNNSYRIISEMEKTILYYQKWELLLIIVLLIGAHIKIIKLSLRDFLLTVGIFLMSLMALRNTAYFYVIIPTIFMSNINVKKKFSNDQIKNILNRIDFKIINTFTIIILISINSYLIIELSNMPNKYNLNADFPDKSVKYIKENLNYKKIKLYNRFDYGSYLEYYNILAFIDSRAEVYMKEFSNKDIIGDYIQTDDYKNYKKVFEKYKFEYALVYNETGIYRYLKDDNDYEIIFEEKDQITYTLFKYKKGL